MPTPPDKIPRLRTTPGVCVCGYDLTGLPADAAAKCPECGAVIAEIEPPVPRFHHWGRLLIAGMTPALGYGVAALGDIVIASFSNRESFITFFAVLGLMCWPLVSFPAFGWLMVRSLRTRSFGGRCVAVVLGVVLSLLANATPIILVTMAIK